MHTYTFSVYIYSVHIYTYIYSVSIYIEPSDMSAMCEYYRNIYTFSVYIYSVHIYTHIYSVSTYIQPTDMSAICLNISMGPCQHSPFHLANWQVGRDYGVASVSRID